METIKENLVDMSLPGKVLFYILAQAKAFVIKLRTDGRRIVMH